MADKKILEEVGKYIEKYYEPVTDDIRLDKEIKSIFEKITLFRKKRAEKRKFEQEKESNTSSVKEAEQEGANDNSVKRIRVTQNLSSAKPINRNIDDLMNQMEETFSQRLLRMIDERGMADSEVYTKARIDRRHFSKIRKDINYVPNKKTVLAFTIALELSLDEAKDLLASAGFALSRSSKVDIVVAYFLQNRIYDMFEVNDVLYAYDQPVF